MSYLGVMVELPNEIFTPETFFVFCNIHIVKVFWNKTKMWNFS